MAVATRRTFSAEERTRALVLLASRAGNCADASRELTAAGLDIAPDRLRSWKKSEEYERIRHDYGHKLEEYLIGEIRERMVAQSDLEELALEKTRIALMNGDIRDPARAMRDISHAKAQNIDKLRVMTGRPTDITENRSLDELVKALTSLGVATIDTVESEAIEAGSENE